MAAVEAAEAVAARDYNEVFDIFLFRRSSRYSVQRLPSFLRSTTANTFIATITTTAHNVRLQNSSFF